MLTRWYDIDRDLAALTELQRRMNKAFGESWQGRPLRASLSGVSGAWPLANLYDTGASLTAVVQVPGLREEDLSVEVHGDALSVSGERMVAAPEGYRVHRTERGARRFTRTFGLPCKVDPERTTARLANGLLMIEMEKHPESQPKKITVSAS